MTDRVDINRVLMQMREFKSQAQNKAVVRPEQVFNSNQPGQVDKGQPTASFSDMLGKAVNSVNDIQKQSGALSQSFEQGDPTVSITQVMVASQKASISFQAMTQVRNKLVNAYEEIMKMPI